MLTLPIKKKWFDMILSGEKREEYRDIKEYYETRFQNLFGALTVHSVSVFSNNEEYELLQGESVIKQIRKDSVQEVIFRNGYSKNSKAIKARCSLRIGKGRPEWGAEPDKQYYILEILNIEELAADKTMLQKAGDEQLEK
ncbi:MAG: ASCH domain-containing protein [Eubacteriales bacterium]|nr:ASCH domain-containing protein [Eubacteriales bacterium]